MRKVMNCVHCKGAMSRSTASFPIGRSSYRLALDAVPAWVCSQCGEPYFDEWEVDTIQDTIHMLDEQTRQLSEGAA